MELAAKQVIILILMIVVAVLVVSLILIFLNPIKSDVTPSIFNVSDAFI